MSGPADSGMSTCRQTAALLDHRLQEGLHWIEAWVLHYDPVPGTKQLHEVQQGVHKELRSLSALAIWLQVPGLQEQLRVLDMLVNGLMLSGANSPERILFHLFCALQRLLHPASREFQQLLQQRFALLVAGRQAGLAEPRVSRACPLGLLQQAGQFLRPHENSGNGIKALLACQDVAHEQLHRVLHYRMQELADACTQNVWTLEACTRSGLARKARQLVQLAAFAPGKLETDLGRVEQLLLRLHIDGGVADKVNALQQLLQGLILGKNMAGQLTQFDGSAASQDRVFESDEEAVAELIAATENLSQVFPVAGEGQDVQVSEKMLRACDRLGWMLDVLGHSSLGLAAHALAYTCLHNWQLRQPLRVSMLDQVQQLLIALRDKLEGLDNCCREPGHNLASSFLAECPEHGQALEPATAIALNLANQFKMLIAVRKDSFTIQTGFVQYSQALQKELRLLEKGAAAVRLRGLEQFTSLLLDIHHLLAVDCRDNGFPAALLWQGHQQLLAMLDAAALWFEPLPDLELMQQMAEWVRNAELLLANAAASLAVSTPQNGLQVALTAFSRKAGNLLGRPVRLTLDVGETGVALQLMMVPVVTEVLRWLLLQATVDSNEGSGQPRTRSIVVQIQCRLLSGARIQTVIVDDRGSKLPDQRMQRRLQRLFPACGIELKAELQQHGKRILELEFAV